MKPSPFDYHCPATLDEALSLLEQHGTDAKPLAGGQSLIPAMNFRLATPAVLVDLNAIEALRHVRQDTAGLRIGAMTRHRTLERDERVSQSAPLVRAAMPFIAHPAIRTRGTIGGSLAHADPAAELPAVMLALDASMRVQSTRGSRSIGAGDFFTGLFATALEPGELLTEIVIPPPPAQRYGIAFEEISRRHGDFALAGAAAVVTRDATGQCTSARLTLLSVADRPVLVESVARLLEGQQPSADTIRAAAATVNDAIDPPSDIHASSRYRRHLATVLTRRVLERAFSQT